MKPKIATEADQPKEFRFSEENLKKAKKIISQYPKKNKASATLPLLFLAQAQHNNWLPRAALNYIAEMLEVSFIKIYEVASFYSMFNLAPIGKYNIQICGTISCWLRGADKIYQKFQEELNIKYGQTTEDKKFTLTRVECLGACVNAPMAQINNDYYEDLTEEKISKILQQLSVSKDP